MAANRWLKAARVRKRSCAYALSLSGAIIAAGKPAVAQLNLTPDKVANWVTPEAHKDKRTRGNLRVTESPTPQPEIIEANGWIISEKGEMQPLPHKFPQLDQFSAIAPSKKGL